jgi:hypothetical protein
VVADPGQRAGAVVELALQRRRVRQLMKLSIARPTSAR